MGRASEWWKADVHGLDLVMLRASLADPSLARALDPLDLVAAALVLRGRASITQQDALKALRDAGLARPLEKAELSAHVASATDAPWIASWDDRLVGTDGARVIERVRALIGRGAEAGNARLLAPPPAQHLASSIAQSLDLERLTALLATPPASFEAVGRALTAFRLASAQSYEELLCLAELRGVEHHFYQIEAVRRVFRQLHGRALLADEVGLGKTVEAMMVLREYQLRGMVKRALVICPAPLVAQWSSELEAKAGVCARTTDDRIARADPSLFWSEPGVVVASLSTARHARTAPLVGESPWDLVIVDEAHHVKNRATLGWKLIDGLETRFLLLLTATPVENDLEELYALVTLLRPGQLTTPADFRKQFVDRKNPTSPKNRERLKRLLGDVMIRNTRAQSGLRLPPRFVTTVCVEPAADERALYDATLALLRAHHEDGAARRAASMLLVEGGSSPRALGATVAKMTASAKHGALAPGLEGIRAIAASVTDTQKTEALLSILRAHAEPALVFTRFRETLEHVVSALERAKLLVHVLRGGMSAGERVDAIEAFRSRGGVLVATGVGSEGTNLQFARLLVNFDLPWNPMVIEQRIGRIHRMGQEREVLVFNLCARGTVEERVLGVLSDRLHLFELVVGEMDMVLGNIADERDLEERILDLYARATDENDIDRGFEVLADELVAARTRYDRAKAFDEALFGEDYET